ncbi:hypothetical protein CEH05_19045 [Halobacillus halophilus]|uniref:Uncharacterized protein n=1 Tax=Halobacillus halophilus (strain ATCC 35676 / DSM 2266 / JCM 20832 / KCTC 3685 / LMG 17431 / NBRC 102448 / NCIMB 2269) TaxID=866895 RepID=I0JSU7_HALH3|nr:IucA/IucC family C-terminal-domain containing protein [Halobacillus halophilus]ASF41142.1 hypothetical protein CEH05_19045 [Halobacillus halophilus]CCG47219.1 hypothetical protein HBHAL_4882 [Halobacillus halophilus DSM 2266]
MNTAFEQIKNNHRIYIGESYEDQVSYKVADLIHDKENIQQLIQIQKHQLGAPNIAITGLLFGKMYSVITMGLFEMIVRHHLILDMIPSNVGIELQEKNKMNYIISEDAVYSTHDLTDEKVKELIHSYLVQHLQPLFQQVAQTTGCKSTHMRSIVSHNLHQKYREFIQNHPQHEEYAEKVFRWFTTEVCFSKNMRNPLHFDFRFYEADNGKKTYVRRHCCMKYMLHGANKAKCCPTCPLISDEERDDRL